VTKKSKPGEGFDELPVERQVRALKALITGDHINPKMRARVLNSVLSDRIAPRDKKKYIHALKAAHQGKSAKQLFDLAAPEVIGPMRFKTFQNVLSETPKK
jgi:hypothetical protein